MSRKVTTPHVVLGNFEFKIYYILVVVILIMIIYAGFKEKHSIVYKDNHIKVTYENNEFSIKNSNEVAITVMIVNGRYTHTGEVKAKSTSTDIELMNGRNIVFVSCQYFEDSFEVSK